MKYCLLLILTLSSFFGGASTTGDKLVENIIDAPLLGNNSKALYKANIKVLGNSFSGLVLFKKNDSLDACDIVMLSEVGITLCNFFYDGENMQVRNASSLFQNEGAQNVLGQCFKQLLHTPTSVKQVSDNKYLYGQTKYFTNAVDTSLVAIKHKRLHNCICIKLKSYKEQIPSDIYIKRRGINFKMNLTLLKLN